MKGVALVCGTLGIASALVVGQQATAPAQPQPIFRAGTEVVQLDVSVVDRDGQPVPGLTRQDFAVSEDGKPQSIVAFKAIDLPDSVMTSMSPPRAVWTNTVARDVSTNQLGNHRLFAIVMDDATIVSDASVLERARDAARSVIDKMGSNDLATVVFTSRANVHVQDFTNDHARLLATVETFSVEYRPVEIDPGAENCSAQLDAIDVLGRMADYLAAAPDQRKAIVYISSSMAVDVSRSDACGVAIRAQDVFRSAQRANVNFYPIDACGLRAGSPCAAGVRVDFLKTIANNTGAQAIVESNDFEPGIAHMFKASGSYYLVGYTPANVQADGTFRRIEVTVPARRDVDVWTRKYYFAPDAKADARRAAQPQQPGHEKLLAGILPNADVSLQMTAAAFQHAGKTATVAIVVHVTRDASPANASDTLDVVVSAFTPENKLVTASRQTTRVTGVSPIDGTLQYEVLSHLDVPAGRYELRAGVHSGALAMDGSVYGDLDVPDFSQAHISLSGVALHVAPALVAEPKDGLAAILPVVPTTQRAFDRGSRVSAFVRLYQGGKDALAPVTLHTWLYDEHDTAIVDRTETVPPAGFEAAGRSADHTYDVPIATLAPGDYVLTFEADKGKDRDARDVRFTVK
jgi:VWFA-related protein